jgi:acylphosphatase
MSGDHTIRHVIIRGRVQGVGYRAWVADTARQHGLEGWVRNRRDGSVEAVFAGAAETVTWMLTACRRGPPLARVDILDDQPWDSNLLVLRSPDEGFDVLPTV